jgi:hypothetical protein
MAISRRMRALSFLWVGLPVLGAAELGGQLWAANRAPTRAEWHAVQSDVQAAKAPEAAIVVAPSWAEPLARAAFGEKLMPLRDVARPGLDGYPSALEVSILGQSAAELSQWPVTKEQRVGRFTLRERRNPDAPRIQFDFVDGLSEADASESDGRDDKPCPWQARGRAKSGGLGGHPTYPAQRFNCPSSEPYLVGVTVIDDQDYRPRRCIHAYPTPNGPLKLRFADVPLGAELRGHGGLPWVLVRDGGGAPVRFEAFVNGNSVGVHEQRDEMGWAGFRFKTGVSPGVRGRVEFRISSDSVQNRHFCFAADLR